MIQISRFRTNSPNILSLSSPKNFVAVAAVDNAIVVIGGCIKGGHKAERKSSSLTTVELGEAELLH